MICGIFPIISILSSFLVGRFLKEIGGRIYIYMCGSLLIIIYITIFGYLDFVESKVQFVFLSFLARILGGIGSGANSTACMAIIISFDSADRERFIGLIEASLGLGLLLGPLIGSAFFYIGGYKVPFLGFGKYNLYQFI